MEGNQAELNHNITNKEKLDTNHTNLDITRNLNSTIIDPVSSSEGNGMFYMIIATVLIFLIYKLFCKIKNLF
jgi:hypothetical protein